VLTGYPGFRSAAPSGTHPNAELLSFHPGQKSNPMLKINLLVLFPFSTLDREIPLEKDEKVGH